MNTLDRKFTIGTTAYIPSLKINDTLDLYLRQLDGTTNATLVDLVWLTNIR